MTRLARNICPVCLIVVITWLVGISLIYLDQNWVSPLLVAILMGASLGATAERWSGTMGMWWKILWVMGGVSGIYFLLDRQITKAATLIIITLALTGLFYLLRGRSHLTTTDKLKNCC